MRLSAVQARSFSRFFSVAMVVVMKTASGGLQRRYPIHDLDSLKISKAYFDQAKSALPPEAVAVAEAKFASRARLLAAAFEAGRARR